MSAVVAIAGTRVQPLVLAGSPADVSFAVRQTTTTPWGPVLLIVLTVIAAWPPDQGKSLAAKFVNWVVDPAGRLPMLPPQLGYGVGDDPQSVEERDAIVREYDRLYNLGGWTRKRLELKVAGDPLERTTERQLLLAAAAIAVFVVWRLAAGKSERQG